MSGMAIGAGLLLGLWLSWPAVVLSGAIAALIALVRHHARAPIALIALTMVAAGLGAWRHEDLVTPVAPAWVDTADQFVGTVMSAPARRPKSQTFTLRTSEVEQGSALAPAEATLCVVLSPTPVVQLGDTITFSGQASPLMDEPPGFQRYLAQRGCAATVFGRSATVLTTGSGLLRTMAIARDTVTLRLQSLVTGDAGVLMSGLVTGDDRAFSADRRDAFVITGTTHITAISGSNFATFVSLLVAAGGLGGWGRSKGWLALIVIVVWAYAVFVGANPPAVRAAIAATATVLAVTVGRRPDVTTLVLLSGALMAMIRPAYVHELSFQLSLAASLGIAVSVPVAAEGKLVWLRSGVVGSTMAQVATLPFLLPLSGVVPLLSIPANVAIGPLVNFAFVASLAATAGAFLLGWVGWLAWLIAQPARWLCEGIIFIVDRFAALGGGITLGRVSVGVAMLVAAACIASLVANSDDVKRWSNKGWTRTSS